MGRSTSRKPADPNGRHIRVYTSLLNSPAYRCLNYASKALYVDLRAAVTGTNNGNISAALSDLKHRGWSSRQCLARALYELRSLGFLAVTREGGLKQGTRVPTLYRFTDMEVFEQPKVGVQPCKATHDYMRFETVAAAEVALREGVEQLRAEGRKKQFPKKSPVPKGNRIGSEREPIDGFIGSEREQGNRASVPKGNRGTLQ